MNYGGADGFQTYHGGTDWFQNYYGRYATSRLPRGYEVRTIAGPYAELFSVDLAKSYLRDEIETQQDDVIELLLQAVREYGEALTRRAWLTQKKELILPYFPSCDIVLPCPPIQWVESITYRDLNGNTTTIAPSVYQYSVRSRRIRPAYQQFWPTDVRTSDLDTVVITYVCGYAPPAGSPTDYGNTVNVPARAKLWAQHKLAQAYEHREAIVVGTIVSELPRAEIDGYLDGLCVDIF